MKLSITNQEQYNYTTNWKLNKQVTINDLTKYAYSNAVFIDNYRHTDNLLSMSNNLILDIDNDKTNCTMNEAAIKLQGLNAIIIPTRSNMIKKNERIVPRFRIIIELKDDIGNMDRIQYKVLTDNIVNKLELNEYVDYISLHDRTRMYFPSPSIKDVIEIQGKPFDIEPFIDEVEKVVEENKEVYYKTITSIESTKLLDINFNIISTFKPYEFIDEYETVYETEQSNGWTTIRTNNNAYSYKHDNPYFLHDFKNDCNYNIFTYFKYIKNLDFYDVCKVLNDISGNNILSINMKILEDTFKSINVSFQNIEHLTKYLKDELNLKYIQLKKKHINILGFKIKYEDFNYSYKKIQQLMHSKNDKMDNFEIMEVAPNTTDILKNNIFNPNMKLKKQVIINGINIYEDKHFKCDIERGIVLTNTHKKIMMAIEYSGKLKINDDGEVCRVISQYEIQKIIGNKIKNNNKWLREKLLDLASTLICIHNKDTNIKYAFTIFSFNEEQKEKDDIFEIAYTPKYLKFFNSQVTCTLKPFVNELMYMTSMNYSIATFMLSFSNGFSINLEKLLPKIGISKENMTIDAYYNLRSTTFKNLHELESVGITFTGTTRKKDVILTYDKLKKIKMYKPAKELTK